MLSVERRGRTLPIFGQRETRTRLSLLEVGERLMVMDRFNGRWIMIPKSQAPLAQLVGARHSDLPENLRQHVKALESAMADAGLGQDALLNPGDLTTLILKLTNACNYACTYCYDYEVEERATTLSFDYAAKALEEALALAPRNVSTNLRQGIIEFSEWNGGRERSDEIGLGRSKL